MPHFRGSEAEIWYEQVGNPTGKQLVRVGGGGTMGRDWRRFQTPHFAVGFRRLVFDNRGIGATRCAAPMPPGIKPWLIERFAHDLAELIAGVCDGPAICIGTSLGSAIIQQLVIERPELVRAAVLMGTGAWSTGWG
jgi:pimeloyl-ACP methyl ester carboxylesterase